MLSPRKPEIQVCQKRKDTDYLDEEIRIQKLGEIKESKEITQLKNEIVRINSFSLLYRNNSDTITESPAVENV